MVWSNLGQDSFRFDSTGLGLVVRAIERERGVFGTRIEREGTRRVVAQHLLIRPRTAVKRSAASLIVVVSSMKLALLLFLVLVSNFLPSSLAAPSSSGDGYAITGRVKVEGMTSKGFGASSKLLNAKIILNGGQNVTFVRADGYFTFHNVPAGTHLIEVAALGYFFSPVRVDISARFPGKIQAALTENRKALHELILEPLREEQYYEIREPFSIMSFLKSPMGLMMGFMLLVIFVMPKLVENMDPEEIRRAQEEMRTNFLPRSS
ncbi:unnamed protein product [Musa acuminata subsp. burmannicoides]